ncbi:MAG: hypothetical protein IJ856_05720 [Candidatus Methanomethylophilaceae archaeon]|nr:hypothetical protein [Candidatus Methanomethylophilaceae archaeon]
MNPGTFEIIKRGLSIEVVGNLIDRYGWSEDHAIDEFMRSKVYEGLQNEETKVWHLSPAHLTELFADEIEGNLVWPEVVR